MITLLHSINHFKNGNFHDFDANESSHRSDLESSNCTADNYRHFNSVNNNSLKNVCIAFDYCHIKNCSKSVCDCSSGCKSSSESTGQTSSSRHSKENESSGDADRLRNPDSFGPPDRSGKDDRSGRRDRSEQDEESGEASGESSGEAGCHGYLSETRYLHESVAGYSGVVGDHLKVLQEVCNDPEERGKSAIDKMTGEILKGLTMETKRHEREKTTLNLNLRRQNNEQRKQRRLLREKLQDLLDLERTCQSMPLQYRQDLQQLKRDIIAMQRLVRNAMSLQRQPHLPQTPPTSTPSSLRLALRITTDEPKTDTFRFLFKIPQTSPPHVSNPQKCSTTTSTAVTGFSQRTPRITSALRAYRRKQNRVKPTARIFTQETTTQAHTEVTTSDTKVLYTLYSGRPVLVFTFPEGYFETYRRPHRRTTSTVAHQQVHVLTV